MSILGFSKLLFVSSILSPPWWVYDWINRIIWSFLWGSRIETVACKSLICPETDRGLGLREFRIHSQASRLAILIRSISFMRSKSIFLLKYFVAPNLLHFRVAGRFYVTTQYRVRFHHLDFTLLYYKVYVATFYASIIRILITSLLFFLLFG